MNDAGIYGEKELRVVPEWCSSGARVVPEWCSSGARVVPRRFEPTTFRLVLESSTTELQETRGRLGRLTRFMMMVTNFSHTAWIAMLIYDAFAQWLCKKMENSTTNVTTGITLSNFLSFLGLFHSIEQLNSGYDSTFSVYQFIFINLFIISYQFILILIHLFFLFNENLKYFNKNNYGGRAESCCRLGPLLSLSSWRHHT